MVANKQSQSGFALLVSLIVVTVVVSIGISILDLTIKQVRLSSNSTDSEIAFHAANAGMECARFWRRNQKLQIEGDPFATVPLDPGEPMVDVSCFGDSIPSVEAIDRTPATAVDGSVYQYTYQLDWGSGQDRCTDIDMIVSVVDFDAASDLVVTTADMRTEIAGYPAGDFVCAPSSVCTAISVKGYNRACGQVSSFGTVQREVLLEF